MQSNFRQVEAYKSTLRRNIRDLHYIRSQLRNNKIVALIGVAKSGTTSFASVLNNQDVAKFGVRKENHVFNSFGIRSRMVKSANKYVISKQNAIARKDTYILESTPLSVYPEAAARMSVALPQAKIVLVVRDPVKRAFSEFRMLKHRCQGLNHLSIKENLRNYNVNVTLNPFKIACRLK